MSGFNMIEIEIGLRKFQNYTKMANQFSRQRWKKTL